MRARRRSAGEFSQELFDAFDEESVEACAIPWLRADSALTDSPSPSRPEAPIAVASTAPEPKVSELMGEDKGEAFSDGGAESRSSEPCLAGQFPAYTLGSPAEPASPAESAEAETRGEAAASAEATVLTEVSAPEAFASIAEDAAPLAIPADTVREPVAASGDAAPQDRIAPDTAPGDAEPLVEKALDPVVGVTDAVVEQAASLVPSPDAAVADDHVGPQAAADADPVPPAEAAKKPSKRGLLGRLFGGRSAEYR